MHTRDIEQARALLERAEREADAGAKADHLVQALELLADVEDDDPEPQERRLIGNIKAAHARRLLAQLAGVRSAALDTWARYVYVLIDLLKPEVRDALAADAQLREGFDRFIALCGADLGERIRAELA